MHVLFIGGTGLISTAIARQLLQAGHEVTLFNRGKRENRLPDAGPTACTRSSATARISTPLSRRSPTRPTMWSWTWSPFTPTNRPSAVRAFAGRCGQFLHCSTVCVYSGPPQTIPTPETEPYHSIGQYGKNKIACEELLLRAHAEQNFPVTILRPSHSYGEGGGIIRQWGIGRHVRGPAAEKQAYRRVRRRHQPVGLVPRGRRCRRLYRHHGQCQNASARPTTSPATSI
jgi:nucleoside-diphosphate-sugar epimerase